MSNIIDMPGGSKIVEHATIPKDILDQTLKYSECWHRSMAVSDRCINQAEVVKAETEKLQKMQAELHAAAKEMSHQQLNLNTMIKVWKQRNSVVLPTIPPDAL